MVLGGGSGTGDLSITVVNAEDWTGPANSATIRLFDKTGQQTALQTTDAAGVTIFSGITTGTGYSYKVNYLSNSQPSPFGEEYWGTKAGIAVERGHTIYETFTRNLPYALSINIHDSLTNADVAL